MRLDEPETHVDHIDFFDLMQRLRFVSEWQTTRLRDANEAEGEKR